MKSIPRVLAVHDLCAFGRCSLTAAVPVLSAMGIQACPFPTAIFSNNFTFGSFEFSDFTERMNAFMDQWAKIDARFDAVYSGFLASVEQMAVVEEAVRRFAGDGKLVVVDPAMGDDGKLYPIYTPAMVDAMRRLVRRADVITPNFTEACFLLDRPYEAGTPAPETLLSICRGLGTLGCRRIVITSVPGCDGEIKVASYDAEKDIYAERVTPRLPFATCGTGDIFTSVLTGALLRGDVLVDAARLAMEFVSEAITHTIEAGTDPREGVVIEPCLGSLIRRD